MGRYCCVHRKLDGEIHGPAGTIGYLGAQVILDGCYLHGNAGYCNLITRSSNGYIDTLTDTNVNIGKLSTGGIDAAARYELRNTPVGRFAFTTAVNWLQKYDVTNPDGSVYHYKGNADAVGPGLSQGGPAWKGVAAVVWGLGGFGAGVDTRYIASYKECGSPEGTSDGGQCNISGHVGERTVNAYNQWNGFVSYQLKSGAGKTTLMLGMSNMFDTKPPIIFSETYTNSNASLYDYMGRFFYLRVAHAL